MKFSKAFTSLFLMMISFVGFAQSDVRAWIGVDAKYDLNKRWSLGMETQTRTDLKLGRLDNAYISPNLSWKIHKHLETGFSYRLSSVPYSKSTTNRVTSSRFSLDFTFRNIEEFFAKKPRLGVSLRLQGTREYEAEKRTDNTLRLKLILDYDLPNSKLDLFASTELFYRFQRDLVYTFSEVQSVDAINKYRVKLGLSYPLGDHQDIKVYGLNQWRYPDGRSEFVIGLGYSCDFSSKKKSKKK